VEASTDPEQQLRERAVERLKKKRDFRTHLFMYVAVNAVLVVIWALTGAGFFWPVFVILGWGIGVAGNAWDVYGRKPFSEEQIRRETDRLRGPNPPE
jgi:2TM domain